MSETVSKTKGVIAPVVAVSTEPDVAPAVVEVKDQPKRKTLTNWRMFEEAGFVPVRWKCEGYLGSHPADLSCHTNLKVTGADIIRHMAPEHGGGWFRVKMRLSDGKKAAVWQELEEAGVEIQQLYCPHCRMEIAMTPRTIIKHLQPHAGANRVNMDPQTVAMTLSFQRAETDEYDELYGEGTA